MDKFTLLKMRKAAFATAEARSTATVADFADKLTHFKPPAPAPVLTGLDKFQSKMDMANSAVGFEMRELPHGAEIARITKMPVIDPMEKPELDAYQRENVLSDALRDGFRLFDLQCEALLAYDLYNGLFGPIGVGWGSLPECA